MGTSRQVLALPTGTFFFSSYFNGFIEESSFITTQKIPKQNCFIEKDFAEKNPRFKQIIPYVVIRTIESGEVLTYIRAENSGEERLHNKLSIGVGGHIEPDDMLTFGSFSESVVKNAAVREVLEEIAFPQDVALSRDEIRNSLRHIGYVNDDMTPVGKVHVGYVYVLDLPKSLVADLTPGEAEEVVNTEIRLPKYILGDDMRGVKEHELEPWARLVLPFLDRMNKDIFR